MNPKSDSVTTPDSTRRTFLRRATAATAAVAAVNLFKTPVYGQSQAPAPGRVMGANDRLVVGIIGLSRGMAHIPGHLGVKNVEIGYVCDVDSARLARGKSAVDAKQPAHPVKAVGDFRRILEDKSVDAISIASPNYWHAIQAIMGCQAGKHVYVEKPGSHNPFEAEALVAAALKSRRTVQMCNQRRSYPNLREGMQRLHEGAIGKVLYSRSWYRGARGGIGKGKPAAVPATLDWKLWQGPAPERPFKDNLVHYNWHWHWHYGGGELANNGIHLLDLARWGLGVNYPQRVTFVGARYHFDDDQETPDTGSVVFDFGASGANWDLSSCHARKAEKDPLVAFYGEKGSMLIGIGNEYSIHGLDGKELAKASGRAEDVPHFKNFADAIREGTPLNSPIVEGQKSTMLCHLGNIAYRTGRVLNIDPKTGRIVKDADAMKLWQREYRPGWEPKV